MLRAQKLFIALTLLATTTSAQTVSPGRAAFDRFFNEVTTLQSNFTQIVLDENLNQIDDTQGRVWIKRPGKFRWNYAPPDEQEIVGDGTRVWLYDVALEQVTVRDQQSVLGRTPAILLAGDGFAEGLDVDYRIEDIGNQGAVDWINLIPRNPESGFTEVRVGFANNELRLLELVDTLDQRTRINFSGVAENETVSDDVFKFLPPLGVDVIDEGE